MQKNNFQALLECARASSSTTVLIPDELLELIVIADSPLLSQAAQFSRLSGAGLLSGAAGKLVGMVRA